MAIILLIQLFPDKALAATDMAYHPLVFDRQDEFAQQLARDGALFPGALITVIATAYSSTPNQTDGDPFTTAAGTSVRQGIIAANFMPLGTVVRIGKGTYVVEDRMGISSSERIIDIWMSNTEEALLFGRRMVTLEIVSIPQ